MPHETGKEKHAGPNVPDIWKVPPGEPTYHYYPTVAPRGIFTNSYRFECKCGREHEIELGIGAKRDW